MQSRDGERASGDGRERERENLLVASLLFFRDISSPETITSIHSPRDVLPKGSYKLNDLACVQLSEQLIPCLHWDSVTIFCIHFNPIPLYNTFNTGRGLIGYCNIA